ncbi:hypothetical protein ASC78_26300 [Variovorax sp. Root318D1]|uniref:RES family NAD+ phosphorylase n=1 Tax=Variovorax sp. Root318D1 TaxID=1736513 RepID=UPI0006F42596|nr:RES family NAD+ phosphorylase [Variovorax sp. Root318D1]KQU86313.1 hypothetical protein ASC78_26300 [Variovorax sp. Root318D1]
MTVSVWRIASETPDYTAEGLGGKGAEITGGRWNRPGMPMVYSATNIALAALETVVHLNAGALPLNRLLVRIDIPDDVWFMRTNGDVNLLAVGWDVLPAGKVSLDIGDGWLRSNRTALFEVPSAIVPEETNVLINPRHADAGRITAVKTRRWTYDGRLTFGVALASRGGKK